jgi:hypothetical protein
MEEGGSPVAFQPRLIPLFVFWAGLTAGQDLAIPDHFPKQCQQLKGSGVWQPVDIISINSRKTVVLCLNVVDIAFPCGGMPIQ